MLLRAAGVHRHVSSAFGAVAVPCVCLVMTAPGAFAGQAGEPPVIRGVVVDGEGRGVEGASVYVETPGRGPCRAAALPTLSPIGRSSVRLRDGETTTLEIALRDVVVSGRVTRGGRGLGGIRVTLSGPGQSVSFPGMPADPAPADAPMLSATTREDGTYVVRREDGTPLADVLLTAEVLGRVPAARALDVSLEGLTDLRLEMGRGLSITGRVLDEGGRAVAERDVFAFGADGFERALTGGDGRFRIEGLGDRPYALGAGVPLAGFALLQGVRPGAEPVTLRAGGRIALRVLSPEGRPVAQALASVSTVDGERVEPSLCVAPPTDDQGRTTLGVPAGQVTLERPRR
jgi:hypothetical protein